MRGLLLGAQWLVAAALPAALARFGHGVAFIWVANALLLAELHRLDRREWPTPIGLFVLASFLATATVGMGVRAALPLALINAAEAMVCAHLLHRFIQKDVELADGREIAGLVAAAIIACSMSALAGAATAHLAVGAAFWPNVVAWTTGHILGILTVTPLALLVLRGDAAGWLRISSRREIASSAVLLLVLAATTCGVFAQTTYPLLFLPFLPLMVCVFRFGRIGATAGLLLLAAISAIFTVKGLGPIHLLHAGPGPRAQFLQLYLAVATLTALPAAAELKRRHRLYSELQRNAAIHRVIVDRTGDLLMTTGLDGRIHYVSPSITALSGFAPADVIGKPAHSLILAEDRNQVAMANAQALAAPNTTVMVEYRARKASGAVGWFEAHIHAIADDAGCATGAVTIVRETSQRKARESDLAAAARTDPLTSLPNRRAFEAAFSALDRTRSTRPIGCVAMFDLDHFKQINDSHGHAVGDEVLKLFGSILSRGVRVHDTVSRLGGEEFGAILVGVDMEQARAVCERIRRLLATTAIKTPNGVILCATVSAGISEIRGGGSLDQNLTSADAALYEAKRLGRNRLAVA